jgi:hypothetical protein
MKWLLTCLLLFVSGSVQELYARKFCIQATKESQDIPVTGLKYLITSQELKVSELAKRKSEFKMLKESMVNLGFERSDVWFILQLTNPEDSIVHKNLHLSNPILDEVDIYALQDGTWQLVGQGGDQRVQALHQYDYLSFPLAFQPKKEHVLLLRVNNGGEQFYFNVSLEETNFSQIKQSKNQLFFGVLFGIMGFIILLNLAVGILFKQRIAYWYTGYALTFTLLQFSLLGLASKYLWPELTFMINRANPLFASLGVFFFLKFTLEYLNIQKHLPRFTHVFEKFQWVLLANAFLSLIPLPIFLWITAISINGMTLLLNLGIFIPLLIILRKQERAAYTYLIAFSLLQVTVFIFILRNFGIIPDSFLAAYGLQLGTALEYVNDYLKAYLSTNTQHLADGMDISIACFDQNSYQLRWSGANNPLWVSRSATTHFLDPTKRPVGKSEREIPFEELEMQLQKGDRLFLFSDGYPDQFGGEQGKKIKTKGLRGWYETSLHLKPNEQLEFLKNAFQNWKHAEEQLDDVCILLVEVN